ncbi:hypothetical protein [Pseudomonas chlororaphis]|uniref:hypothetical protein n=1 Tax=Pseudomonas chlororaphis TaxID=587753 RepID=UPI0015E01B5A|nr:hypothetical protein [Pseudomonas chlororaphis]QLL11745.1 hypothetical protein H0I86_22330 [Pseudomonas chlororaphis subsp. aurantiaca]
MPTEIKISTGHPDAGRIYAQALARVTAERDALHADLTARDQRVADLEGLLQETISAWAATQFGDPPTELAKVIARIKPALNPTPKPHTCCGNCPAGCIGAKP